MRTTLTYIGQVLGLAVFVLVACTNEPGLGEAAETHTPSSPTAVTQATLMATIDSTSYPTIATATPRPGSTATPSETARPAWTTRCLDIQPSLTSKVLSDGILVLNQRESTGISHATVLDMQTGITSSLSEGGDYLVGINVSPDRLWLAYGLEPFANDRSAGRILFQNVYGVMSADGDVKSVFARDPAWFGLSHWLDDTRLVFGQIIDSEVTEVRRRDLVVMEPISGARSPLVADFPDIYDRDYLYPVPDWENYIGVTTYDSTLTRVVYARIDADNVTGYVLWDIANQQALAFLESPYINQSPIWSPDQSKFVVVAYLAPRDSPDTAPEFFSVSRNGDIERLTNLSAGGRVRDIAHYSWSPDGRYVAFQYHLVESPRELLAVLDTETKTITDYCIPGDEIGVPTKMYDLVPSRFTTTVPPPIWSPDGHALVVENRFSENSSRAILIDLAQGIAVQVAENVMPVGWLADN
jgi:hypothetical protein